VAMAVLRSYELQQRYTRLQCDVRQPHFFSNVIFFQCFMCLELNAESCHHEDEGQRPLGAFMHILTLYLTKQQAKIDMMSKQQRKIDEDFLDTISDSIQCLKDFLDKGFQENLQEIHNILFTIEANKERQENSGFLKRVIFQRASAKAAKKTNELLLTLQLCKCFNTTFVELQQFLDDTRDRRRMIGRDEFD